MVKAEEMEEMTRLFAPEEVDLNRGLDELLLEAASYRNMSPYFTFLAKSFNKPIANLRSRYNYLRRRAAMQEAGARRRGRPRKIDLGAEADVVEIFSELFRVKPSRDSVSILRDCVAKYGALRVAMAMERIRPEGGEVFAKAVAMELGHRD